MLAAGDRRLRVAKTDRERSERIGSQACWEDSPWTCLCKLAGKHRSKASGQCCELVLCGRILREVDMDLSGSMQVVLQLVQL